MLHHRLLDAVEIRPAVDVVERAAFGALDDQRLVLGHLREGVPDELAIPVEEFVASEHGQKSEIRSRKSARLIRRVRLRRARAPAYQRTVTACPDSHRNVAAALPPATATSR